MERQLVTTTVIRVFLLQLRGTGFSGIDFNLKRQNSDSRTHTARTTEMTVWTGMAVSTLEDL
jgi:hypothetical protein